MKKFSALFRKENKKHKDINKNDHEDFEDENQVSTTASKVEKVTFDEHITDSFSKIEAIENPEKDQLIGCHREINTELKTLRVKYSSLQSIVYELADAYQDINGDCICFKYSDMKIMIESTMDAYERTVSRAVMEEDSDSEKQSLISPISKLLQHSRRFSLTEQTLKKQCEAYNNMSSDDLYKDLLTLNREHERLGILINLERARLDKLHKRYKDAMKKCLFCSRHSALTQAIEETIQECLIGL